MKKPSFLQGVLVAAVLALPGSVFVALLTPIVGMPAAIKLLIPLLGLAYLLYLFSRNSVRTGRVTALLAWATVAVATWWIAPPLSFYLLLHTLLIWLLRSLYYYSSVLPSLLDLALGMLAAAATGWAATHSGSVLLATWCFFLVQAAFVAIPRDCTRRQREPAGAATGNEAFERARRQADAALRQLFTHERL